MTRKLKSSLIKGAAAGSVFLAVEAGIAQPGAVIERGAGTSETFNRAHTIAEIGIIAVTDGKGTYWSDQKIRDVTKSQTDVVSASTAGQWQFTQGSLTKIVEQPKGRMEKDKRPCYTIDQLEQIEKRTRGREAITLTYINHVIACNGDTVAGWATGNQATARAYLDIPVMSSRAPAHEIGHLLSPGGALGLFTTNGKQTGLPHQQQFTCKKGLEGSLERAYDSGSIQQLLADDCTLETYLDDHKKTEVKEYSSYDSIMGSGALLSPVDKPWRGVFSPAEIAYLQPDRKVIDVTNEKGKHYLSYDEGELFGATITLPQNHSLRRSIESNYQRTVDKIFFGPVIEGSSRSRPSFGDDGTVDFDEIRPMDMDVLTNPQAIRNVKAFGVSNDMRESFVFNHALFTHPDPEGDVWGDAGTSVIRAINHPDRYSNLSDLDANYVPVYADEELDLIVVTGKDRGGEYIIVTDYGDQRARKAVQRLREKTNERDRLITGRRDP